MEVPVHLTKDLKGIRLKSRQSLRIRNWFQRQVEKNAKSEKPDRFDPKKWYPMSVNLDEMIAEHEEECLVNNDFQYQAKVRVDRLLQDFDGSIVVVTGGNNYWCGILSMFPWEEVSRDEDWLVQNILDYHVFRDENRNVFFDFNEASPLNEWFLKKWHIGDVPCNVSTILFRVRTRLLKMLENDEYDRYHEWETGGKCPECKSIMFDKKGRCPDCGKELKYGKN